MYFGTSHIFITIQGKVVRKNCWKARPTHTKQFCVYNKYGRNITEEIVTDAEKSWRKRTTLFVHQGIVLTLAAAFLLEQVVYEFELIKMALRGP